MSTQPATEEQDEQVLVTVTWTTTTVDEHRATFTTAQLRDAVNAERQRLHLPTDADWEDDLDLLTDWWLADHETEPAGLLEFNRNISAVRERTFPPMPTFTVTIEGPERHDGALSRPEARWPGCLGSVSSK